MKTVGRFLKEERIKQKKTLEDISAKTKIRPFILEQLENAQYENLPSRTYVRGFVKAYAEALGLESQKALAYFRRDYNEEDGLNIASFEPRQDSWAITPAAVFSAIGIAVLAAFFVVVAIQVREFSAKPLLVVDEPLEGTIVSESNVIVSGKAEVEAQVFINDSRVVVTDAGTFTSSVNLISGSNTIVVEAINAEGENLKIERIVVRE